MANLLPIQCKDTTYVVVKPTTTSDTVLSDVDKFILNLSEERDELLLNLQKQIVVSDKLAETLRILIGEQVDYMQANRLGDPVMRQVVQAGISALIDYDLAQQNRIN